jgi:hypothetical protein
VKIIYVVVVVRFLLLHTSYARNRGACVTPQNVLTENVEEGPMMAITELLENWVSSGKANSISGKVNQVTQVSQTCLSYPKLFGSDQDYPKVTLA